MASGDLPSKALAPGPGAPLRALAATWWLAWHLPRVAVKTYGVRAAKKGWFALAQRRGRRAALREASSLDLVDAYRAEGLARSDRYLAAEGLEHVQKLLDRAGCREAVRQRKAQAPEDAGAVEYFHLSQEPLPAEALRELFEEILPPDLVPTLELARGRALRCLKVTYHETSPTDPVRRVGATAYNGHPFHCDGNPKFAKALLYLNDVDEGTGPFEMVPDSRFPFVDSLLRLAYSPRHFRGRGETGRRMRAALPSWLIRGTHLWELDADGVTARYGAPIRVVGPAGTLAIFDGMNLHNGSRDQRRPREVLHFVFS